MERDTDFVRAGLLALALFFSSLALAQHLIGPLVLGALSLPWSGLPGMEWAPVPALGPMRVGAFVTAVLELAIAAAVALGVLRLRRDA